LSDDSIVHFSDKNDFEETKWLTGKFPSMSKEESMDWKLTTNETLHEVEILAGRLKYAEDENNRL